MKRNWKLAFEVVQDSLKEEVKLLDALINDDDSSCPVRELRRARRDGINFAIATLQIMETWEIE